MPRSAFDRSGRLTGLPPTAPGQKIGLLGGSFNPPHSAHLQISEVVLKRLGLDQVWWLVTPGNPLKGRAELAPLGERLVLCRAVAKNPRIEVTSFERDLPAPYTAETLAFLKRRSPLVRFIWIMGADNLADFHRWRRWREILTMVPIVVVDRPGWRLKALASKAARAFAASKVPETEARALVARPPPAWTFLTGPLSPVSSTDLRKRARPRGRTVARKTQGSAPTLPQTSPQTVEATPGAPHKAGESPLAGAAVRATAPDVPHAPQADRGAARTGSPTGGSRIGPRTGPKTGSRRNQPGLRTQGS
jgi:nicotinate-nucleotide adenylyltransferase